MRRAAIIRRKICDSATWCCGSATCMWQSSDRKLRMRNIWSVVPPCLFINSGVFGVPCDCGTWSSPRMFLLWTGHETKHPWTVTNVCGRSTNIRGLMTGRRQRIERWTPRMSNADIMMTLVFLNTIDYHLRCSRLHIMISKGRDRDDESLETLSRHSRRFKVHKHSWTVTKHS